MKWVTQSEAASELNCSIRTIRRRVQTGELDAKREGKRALVRLGQDLELSQAVTAHVEPDKLALVGKRLYEIAAASAVESKKRAELLDTLTARLEEDHARFDREIQRARRRTAWAWIGLVAVAVSAVSVFAVLGGRHQDELNQARKEVAEVQADVAAARAQVVEVKADAVSKTDQLVILQYDLDAAREVTAKLQGTNTALSAQVDALTARLNEAWNLRLADTRFVQTLREMGKLLIGGDGSGTEKTPADPTASATDREALANEPRTITDGTK